VGSYAFGIAVLVIIGIASSSSRVEAQGPALGYSFAGPIAVAGVGERSYAGSFGGGGELWTGRGTSVGGELGYLYFPSVERRDSCCVTSMPSFAGLLASGNVSRHFAASQRKGSWQPFITGGLSYLSGREPVGFFNIGGGVERWITPHAGIRFEIREQFGAGSLLGLRVGVVFR
jgi:hypothetical protein